MGLFQMEINRDDSGEAHHEANGQPADELLTERAVNSVQLCKPQQALNNP
jgi:hypothetical protein